MSTVEYAKLFVQPLILQKAMIKIYCKYCHKRKNCTQLVETDIKNEYICIDCFSKVKRIVEAFNLVRREDNNNNNQENKEEKKG